MENDETYDFWPDEYAAHRPKTKGLPAHSTFGHDKPTSAFISNRGPRYDVHDLDLSALKEKTPGPFGNENAEYHATRFFDSEYELSPNANRERVKMALERPHSLTAEMLLDALNGRPLPLSSIPPDDLRHLYNLLNEPHETAHGLALQICLGKAAVALRAQLRDGEMAVREAAQTKMSELIIAKRQEIQGHLISLVRNGTHVQEKAFRSGIKNAHGTPKPTAHDMAKKHSRIG